MVETSPLPSQSIGRVNPLPLPGLWKECVCVGLYLGEKGKLGKSKIEKHLTLPARVQDEHYLNSNMLSI